MTTVSTTVSQADGGTTLTLGSGVRTIEVVPLLSGFDWQYCPQGDEIKEPLAENGAVVIDGQTIDLKQVKMPEIILEAQETKKVGTEKGETTKEDKKPTKKEAKKKPFSFSGSANKY